MVVTDVDATPAPRRVVTIERTKQKDGKVLTEMSAESGHYKIVRNKGGAEARRAKPKVRGKAAVKRAKAERRAARENAARVSQQQ